MTNVELFPMDIDNQKTIQQGHPPGWTNRAADDVAFPQKFTQAAIATAKLCVANALDSADRRAWEVAVAA